jgi:hypothetical protein
MTINAGSVAWLAWLQAQRIWAARQKSGECLGGLLWVGSRPVPENPEGLFWAILKRFAS